MIRPITIKDLPEVLTVAVKSGLFEPNDLGELASILQAHFDDDKAHDHFWLVDDDGGLQSVAYVAPEQMTDRTWNLHMIAVTKEKQGQGLGTKMIGFVEQTLSARGERMLVVETSGTAEFEQTRAFYRKCGYDQEARIRDFYATTNDKIVFRKLLVVC